MKLIRFGKIGNEKPGVIFNGARLDTSSFGEKYDETFFATDGPSRLEKFVNQQASNLPVVGDDIRLGSPIERPSKLICIGLNYKDHAAETGAAIPDEPVIFMKSTTAIIGPNDNVMIPKGLRKLTGRSSFVL